MRTSATEPDAADVSMKVFQDWTATATTRVVAVGALQPKIAHRSFALE